MFMTRDRPAWLTELLGRLGVSKFILAVVEDSFLYSIGPLLAGFAALIMLPILTRILSPADYGMAETAVGFVATLTSFLIMGTDSAAGRFFFQADLDDTHKRLVLSTAFIFLVSVGLGAFVACTGFPGTLSWIVFGDDRFRDAMLIALVGAPFQTVEGYLKHVLRWQRRRMRYLVVYVVPILLRFVLAIVLAWRFGPMGMIAGTVAGFGVSAAMGFWLGRDSFVPRFSWEYLISFVKFGAPLAITGVALPLMLLVDRTLLIRFKSFEEVGLYVAGTQLGMLYCAATEGFRQAWGPMVFSIWDDEERFERLFPRLVTLYCLGALVLIVALQFLSRPVVSLMLGPEYAGAHVILGVAALGWMAQDLYSLLGVGLFYRKQTHYFALASFLGIVAGVVLDLLLIPMAGILGAAVANTVGRFVAAGVACFYAQRFRPIGFEWGKMAMLALMAMAALLAAPWRTG